VTLVSPSQMHGLVLVKRGNITFGHSIIWCDSPSVRVRDKAFHAIGENIVYRTYSFTRNFTASKLAVVEERTGSGENESTK